jgi:propionyl-CoA carboxylase alpha chain
MLDIGRQIDGIAVHFVDPKGNPGAARVLVSSWKPGDPLWSGLVDGRPVAVQVRPVPNGFLLAHRGVEAQAFVYTDLEAQVARLMPVKTASDAGKRLLCPMPGLVVSVAVAEGQEVKAGETLAVVEAMKMENVLRAERDGVVKAIRVKPGDSLAVDQVILEFA